MLGLKDENNMEGTYFWRLMCPSYYKCGNLFVKVLYQIQLFKSFSSSITNLRSTPCNVEYLYWIKKGVFYFWRLQNFWVWIELSLFECCIHYLVRHVVDKQNSKPLTVSVKIPCAKMTKTGVQSIVPAKLTCARFSSGVPSEDILFR